MERQRLKTGKLGLGTMIHSVHMTDDVAQLNRFYEEVFGGLLFMGIDEPNYLPVEDRYAGLVLISDLCIETMAPKTPADPTKPVGKFYTKFEGARFEILHLGDALLRLAQPLKPTTPLGQHVARWGNMIYGITLVVRDLDAAQDWLSRKSVRTTRLNPEVLAADPADTFGAPYFFTATTFAGDPFA